MAEQASKGEGDAAEPRRLPPEHPWRVALTEELHARPTEPIVAPARLSFLALLCEEPEREAAWAAMRDLAQRHGAPPPPPGAVHYSAELGGFRVKWELHTEFYRCVVLQPGAEPEHPFAAPAIDALPADWVAALPGRLIAAGHLVLLRGAPDLPRLDLATAARHVSGGVVAGSALAGGAATVLSDFRLHADGFARFLIEDRAMTRRQAGRMMQRLIEIDIYRAMAQLALPVARALAPVLTRFEQTLSEIAATQVEGGEAGEAALLDRLTRLAADVESWHARTRFRFDAGAAYYALVERRLAELRELRIEGFSTLQEFLDRRLAPARATCIAVARRHEALSQHVARATQLLSTRVGVTRERQAQALLASMDRRGQLQLHLQQTVEGLSIAAITYYITGLLAYLAKGAKSAGVLKLDPELVAAAGIPVVALAVGLGILRIRRSLSRHG
ncbi:DUF3422 family protein [Roseicella frigidaeris]|uniref:DUF3422 domain-containing protein n=1 Tax=Roseicella frigidaeris TaxID=2230885 RepID=A0A327M5M4_9PROT|nr:DUF3422 domain-containing protein [Roseicella frigidaeris]RAI57676.1 DUF3422 domain-containing protein [Roseicella frigidaeris]